MVRDQGIWTLKLGKILEGGRSNSMVQQDSMMLYCCRFDIVVLTDT